MATDIARMETTLGELRAQLRDGLLVSTVWDRATGLALVGYNSNDAAVALLTHIVEQFDEHLAMAGMPLLSRFAFLELQHNRAGLVVLHGKTLLHGILVDTSKTNIGVLMAVVLPKMLSGA